MSFFKTLAAAIASDVAKSKPSELPIPEVDTVSYAVVGEEYYLTERQMRNLKPGYLVASPEPKNKHDRNAVVMHDITGRKIGYMYASLAKKYQPLLTKTGPIKVPMTKNGNVIKYQIATVAALKKYVANL